MELNGLQLPVAMSGSDLVWDLSSIELSDPQEVTVSFEPASSTPFHSSYPSANWAVWEGDLENNADFQYFNNSPFELRLLGGVHVEAGVPENITFCPDPFLVMDYPMNIGSGVQHVYDCASGAGEIDNWVILATGRVVFDGGHINDLVLWRSIYTGPGYVDTSFFWTEMDNVLYPVVRYDPGASLRIRKPLFITELSTSEIPMNEAAVELFPNPTTDRFTVRSLFASEGDMQVTLFDAMGRTVEQVSLMRSLTDRVDIDVNDLASGTYVVESRTRQGAIQRVPLIKQ